MDRRRREHAGEIAHAAARGTVAAMAMTGARTVTQTLGLVPYTPPEAVLERGTVGDLRNHAGPATRAVLIQSAHWAYGAFGGAVFGSMPDTVRRRPWAGPVYGSVLWLAFEAVISPMLGLPRAGTRSERVALLADHVLYGLVLSEIRRRPQA